LDIGINFWDTADVYGNGANEKLISKILKPNRSKIFIATKFGFTFDNNEKYGAFNGSPEYIKVAVEGSLKRLHTDVIDFVLCSPGGSKRSCRRYYWGYE